MTPKRQKFYTENPYYTLHLAPQEQKEPSRPPLEARLVHEVHKNQESQSLPPLHPSQQPEPMPHPPTPRDEPAPDILVGLIARALSPFLPQPVDPLPAFMPSANPPVRFAPPDGIPIRTVQESTKPSERVNHRASQRLESIRKFQEARLQQASEQAHVSGNPALLQGLIQAYGPNLMPEETASTPEVYDVPPSSSLTASVQQLLNPGFNANSFIYEDPGFIQGNLAYAQSPHTLQAQLRQCQAQLLEQERFEMQQAWLKEQIETEKARQRAINLQAWFNMQKDGATRFAQNTYDFVIGDDVKTLQDPKASPQQKALSAGSLIVAANPAGAAEKTAVKALWKWLLAALAAARIWQTQKKDHSNTEDSTADNTIHYEDNDHDECYLEYLRDINRCRRRWQNNFSRRRSCESTAASRLGDCITKRGSTQLDIWPE